ncbi:MAG: hypothetical protein RLT87_04845 [Gammaproteobacteria bacterium]
MSLFSVFKFMMPLVLATCIAGGVQASPTQALSSLEAVTNMYEAGNYDETIALLTDAVVTEPDNAAYHHLLAKSYGRSAQQVSWLKAIEYARKTRTHLEIAVKLEANNLVYLDDLMDYYLEAPVFLGGSKRKADEIATRISQLRQLSQI